MADHLLYFNFPLWEHASKLMKINGEAFQKARENQLLSTIGLAKMADVSPNVIRSLEQGHNIRPESIRKIIEALGLSIEDAQKKGLIKT